MKRIVKIIVSLSLFTVLFSGCGTSHEGEVRTQKSASDYKGQNYEEVVTSLEEQGFTNVSTKPIEDLITGWITKDGEIEKVSINGDEDFSSYHWYPANSEVIVEYHTFPPKEDSNKKDDTPTTKEEKTTEDDATSEEVENIENTTTEEGITEEEKVEESTETLTVENCEDFARLLSTDAEYDSSYISFVNKYEGKTVEFDGCITYIANHDDYKTRYDLLLSGGDYIDDDTANPGPTFKFKDVNTNDLGIDDLYLPSFVNIRSNIHIIATIESINEDTGIIELDPIAITERWYHSIFERS